MTMSLAGTSLSEMDILMSQVDIAKLTVDIKPCAPVMFSYNGVHV